MPAEPVISTHVVFSESEFYWAGVRATVHQFHKFLIVCAIVALLLVMVLILAYLEPRPGADAGAEWRRLLDNLKPAFAFFLFPAVLVFVMPLINSRKFFSDPRSKDGVRFQFSDSSVSTETFIGKAAKQK